jgi:hypothetical protein
MVTQYYTANTPTKLRIEPHLNINNVLSKKYEVVITYCNLQIDGPHSGSQRGQ